ncbi:hypothetical protein SEVIR_6G050950v4 [Setaria viridis]
MTVKPTAIPAPHLALDVIKGGGAGMEPKKRARPWTHIVRYVSLYYLVNVIGNRITIEGFRRLIAAGDTDLVARGRATGGHRRGEPPPDGVGLGGDDPVGHAAVPGRRHGRVHPGDPGRGPIRALHHGRVRLLLPLPASVLIPYIGVCVKILWCPSFIIYLRFALLSTDRS